MFENILCKKDINTKIFRAIKNKSGKYRPGQYQPKLKWDSALSIRQNIVRRKINGGMSSFVQNFALCYLKKEPDEFSLDLLFFSPKERMHGSSVYHSTSGPSPAAGRGTVEKQTTPACFSMFTMPGTNSNFY